MTLSTRWVWLALPMLAMVLAYLQPEGQELSAQPPVKSTAADEALKAKINPFFAKYCNSCHNSEKQAGGVPLDIYKDAASARKDRKMMETILRVVANGEMPPKKAKAQPTAQEKAEFLTLTDDSFIKVNCVGPKDPGRVTLRRLNRAEYNNTVRDLCGITFHPADDFPSDDVGYGFDNIGDVLSMPPILLEKYLRAADTVLEAAVAPPGTILSSKQGFSQQNLVVMPRSAKSKEPKFKIHFETEGWASMPKFNFPASGEYMIRVRAHGVAQGDQAPKLQILIDDKAQETRDINAKAEKPETVEIKRWVDAGERKVTAAFVNPSDKAKLDGKATRSLDIENISIEGPLKGADKPLPASTKMILVSIPTTPDENKASAKKVLTEFARRAYRRPVKPEEIDRLMKLFTLAEEQGDRFDRAILLPLKAILVSPHFLFRVENDPLPGQETRTLSEFELASRLSYFLWSSMPDAELIKLAEKGELRKPGVLKSQIARMLKDPKSSALTENFAGQWLQLRNLRTLTPDVETFPRWEESLRTAMIKESEMFFDHIVKNDRSVLEFLDADYTFLNDRLSWHYHIPNIQGEQFRYVKLTDKRRGGLVTQAAILTVTSNPTRTSPVKRGKWVYENILGLQPPPAAPDVPELPPNGQLKGTLRQQMEQHRSNPACAGCHAKLDPLGFGLENFDAVGEWRDQDNKIKIDSSGVLPEGEKFNGPTELRKVLLGKSEMFRRCLAEKLLTFATGRGLEYYDKCVLDEISLKLKTGNDQFSALVLAIVESDAFQKRKANRSE
jgi:Protein of unknown function (DUF1592)/Protein of unknown function (DUF1588)/Protein of unknown function (DUF1587)/Protein of unknown function (DUF1585)/Protein of unknown function (DUF1595)/Ca-dependent carbohydrate-binding module xylan-binding/Planctomycete cytochrome C